MKKYSSPKIDEIKLDNQISLQLASEVAVSPNPPGPPSSAPRNTESAEQSVYEDGLYTW